MNLTLLASAVLVCAARASAQCGSWSDAFAFPGTHSLHPGDALVLDDGGGPVPYVSGGLLFPLRAVVQRFVAGNWQSVLELPISGFNYRFGPLTQGDLGAGPCLFAGRSISVFQSEVWQWNIATATWTTLPPITGYGMPTLRVLDDGSGPQLYTLLPATNASIVWRWNGTSWSTLPALPMMFQSITVYDSGAGPALYAGSDPSALNPQPTDPTLRRWNGSAWIAVDADDRPVRALETYDDGTGTKLYVAHHTFGGPGVGPLTVWDGTTRTSVLDPTVTALAAIFDFAKVDFGTGEQLFVTNNALPVAGGAFLHGTTWSAVPNFSGAILAAGDTSGAPSARLWLVGGVRVAGGVGCAGVASYDGANWATLGRGFDQQVRAFEVADLGAGEQLFAAGDFLGAGYATGVNRLARWDGANWQSLGSPVTADEVFGLDAYDLGAGTRLFACGSFFHVNNGPGAGVAEFDGANWTSPAGGIYGDVLAVHGCDVGAGPRLYAGGSFIPPSTTATRIAEWDGAGAWTQVGGSVDGTVYALTSHDDGTGLQLYAGGAFTNAEGSPAQHVARWNGSVWSPVGAGLLGGDVRVFCAFASGGATQLYAGGTFTGNLARWDGTTWSTLPGGAPNGAVYSLAVHDDGRGPALYAGGVFQSAGSVTTYNIARFDGASWEAVDGGFDSLVAALADFDDDGDGDGDLFAGGSFLQTATLSSGYVARLEGCPHYTSFCFGDGSLADHTTACPCGNDGAAGHGCASGANASGALLAASGSTQLDTVVLAGSGFAATAYGLYLQHDAQDDRVFHDGVLCAGGNLLRLRNRNASGGASQFPDPAFAQDATLTLSQRGFVTPGSGATRYYSVFYRSPAATFCPPATANVTNGVRVLW